MRNNNLAYRLHQKANQANTLESRLEKTAAEGKFSLVVDRLNESEKAFLEKEGCEVHYIGPTIYWIGWAQPKD